MPLQVSPDTELANSRALKIKRQMCLAKDWNLIMSQQGMFSHGDTLMVLSPEIIDETLCQVLINRYQRAIFYGDKPVRDQIRNYLSGADYFISGDFTLIEGNASDVIPLSRRATTRHTLPSSLHLEELSGPERMHVAELLERTQDNCGLDSLPPAFLCDLKHSRTVYLTSDRGDIAAVSTVADLSSVGGEWQTSAMVLRTSVMPDYRRMGLGTYIKAEALLRAHDAFHSEHFVGIVGGDNVASFRMNSAVGLIANPKTGFLGVENRH